MSDRTAIVRRLQRGRKRTVRRQSYRRNRAKSRSQGKRWRAKNKNRIKRNRRKRKRNPAMHRLRHARAFFGESLLSNEVAFWDLAGDCEGSVTSVGANDRIHTIVDGSPRSYSVDDFLAGCVALSDEDEDELFRVLDPLFEDTEHDLTGRVAALYLEDG